MTLALRALLLLAGVSLALVAGYSNARFWAVTMAGAQIEAQVGFVAISIACGVIKAGVPAYIAVACIPWRKAPAAALAAFGIAVVFDVASGLGYAGMTRAAATAEQREANRKFEAATRARADAAAVLSALPEPARSVERINADMAAADAVAGGCARATRPTCGPVHKLRGEAADAHAWHAAREALTRAEAALARMPAPRDPDPQLAAIDRALTLFGVRAQREHLEAAWGLLMLLLLEFGAFPLIAFALAPLPSRPAPPDVPDPLPPAPPLAPEHKALLAALAALPADADGWAPVDLAALAVRLGKSPSTVSRDVNRLVAAGRLAKASRGNRGYSVRAT